jgi:hypothetical protein
MPMYDYKYLLTEADSTFGASGVLDNVAGTAIDFGSASPDQAKSGNFGLHVVVTTTVTITALNSGAIIWITGSDTDVDPLIDLDKIIGRFFAKASLLAGKHFFIPCPPTMYRYMSAEVEVVSESSATGAITAWFGPGIDGAE